MKRHFPTMTLLVGTLLLGFAMGFGCSESASDATANAAVDATPTKPNVKRVGQIIGLKPEMKDKYLELHANTWPGVLKRLGESKIRNYSIYLGEIEDKLYLFSYFEYVGDDWEADMKAMADDETTKKWWKETDPCQVQIPGTPEGSWWKELPSVFFMD